MEVKNRHCSSFIYRYNFYFLSLKYSWYIAALWWQTPQSSVNREKLEGKRTKSLRSWYNTYNQYVCMSSCASMVKENLKISAAKSSWNWDLENLQDDVHSLVGDRIHLLLLHIHQTYLSSKFSNMSLNLVQWHLKPPSLYRDGSNSIMKNTWL